MNECIKSNGRECQLALECEGGWGAVAFAETPVQGFGASCGMEDAFWARIVALSECIVASKSICWTDTVFDSRGRTVRQDDDHQFDQVFYTQTVLQIRGYSPGSTDGRLGSQTIDAVRRFQSNLGRPATGTVDDELIYRLYDAVDGGSDLAKDIKHDVLDAWSDKTKSRAYGSANSPLETTYAQQLMDKPPADRMLALATILSSSGTKCTLPAVGAELLSGSSPEIWNIECAEGWYTLIIDNGARTIMTGKGGSDTKSTSP
jgi:peptidoglycan hydrolase-like protein with peptidoglycan-binding domain